MAPARRLKMTEATPDVSVIKNECTKIYVGRDTIVFSRILT
jgi:hypothetical protein